jgi:glycosyl transferase family 25
MKIRTNKPTMNLAINSNTTPVTKIHNHNTTEQITLTSSKHYGNKQKSMMIEKEKVKSNTFRFSFHKENTFCIYVDSYAERWERMKFKLQKMNMEVTYFPATTPADLPNIMDIQNQRFKPSLKTLQKCCAYSHVRLWRHILQNNIPYALILEDDACFDKQWQEKLDRLLLTPDFELSNFDTIMLNAYDPAPVNMWSKARCQFLTGGYIISQRGVKAILEMFHNNYASSDWMTSRLQTRWNSYCYFPWLIIQEGDESTIGSGVDADHAKVIRCLGDVGYSLNNYII